MVTYLHAPENHIEASGHKTNWICEEITRKKWDPAYTPEMQDEISAFTRALMESGNRFEQEVVYTELLGAIGSHFVIDTTFKMGPKKIQAALSEARTKVLVAFAGDRTEESLALRETLTHELAKEPGKVRVLWNPRLRKWRKNAAGRVVWGTRAAEPDVMYRQNARASITPRWGAIDVKWHHPFEGTKKGLMWNVSALSAPWPDKSTPEAWEGIMVETDALQLSHYYRALEFHSLAGDPLGGIIGKPLNGELKVVWLDLGEPMYERATVSALGLYDEKFARLLDIAEREVARQGDPSLSPLCGPEWKSACGECVWRTTCHDELSVSDHITLLPGMTPLRAQAHYSVGIKDVASLAGLHTPTAKVVDEKVANLTGLIAAARNSELDSTSPVEAVFAGVANPKDIAKSSAGLRKAGINTVGELAGLDMLTGSYPTSVYNLTSTIDQARVTDIARVRKMPHVFMRRGLDALEIPAAKVEIHVDMENDEHIYLWGVRVVWHSTNRRCDITHEPQNPQSDLVSFAGTDEGEAQVMVSFWKYLQEIITKAHKKHGADSVKVFHYSPAEDRCMLHLAAKYAGTEGMPSVGEVQEFLNSKMWVDLMPVMTKQLVWPVESHTLKSLAKYARFIWRDTDPSGSNSVVWYKRALDPEDPEHEMMQQRIIDYNADDCEATAELLSWLQRFGEVKDLSRKLGRVEDLEKRYGPKKVR